MAKNKTRERIKSTAQRLIAEHGIDGVSVRDIVAAAGQKNMASLHYYFKSKELLLKELIVDCVKLTERRRETALRALAATGREIEVRELVEVLVRGSALGEADDPDGTMMRFFTSMYPNHRRVIAAAVGDKGNKSLLQCLEMIRRRVHGIDPQIVNTRLLFATTAIVHLLAARESARASSPRARQYWGSEGMIENIIDCVCGMLFAPVSARVSSNPVAPKRETPIFSKRKPTRNQK